MTLIALASIVVVVVIALWRRYYDVIEKTTGTILDNAGEFLKPLVAIGWVIGSAIVGLVFFSGTTVWAIGIGAFGFLLVALLNLYHERSQSVNATETCTLIIGGAAILFLVVLFELSGYAFLSTVWLSGVSMATFIVLAMLMGPKK